VVFHPDPDDVLVGRRRSNRAARMGGGGCDIRSGRRRSRSSSGSRSGRRGSRCSDGGRRRRSGRKGGSLVRGRPTAGRQQNGADCDCDRDSGEPSPRPQTRGHARDGHSDRPGQGASFPRTAGRATRFSLNLPVPAVITRAG
jgi:hypothetical protein